MKGFSFSSLLIGGVVIVLLISTIMMAYVMYNLAYSKPFEWDANDITKVTTKGIEAQAFWKGNKTKLIVPTVSNIVGMVMLGLFYVMG